MGRLNFFVSVILMLSAISLVTARYQARQLFVELDRSRAQAHELDIVWRQLQLDRAEMARNAHVDRLAREELKMLSIVPDRTIYINQPVVPQGAASTAAAADAPAPLSGLVTQSVTAPSAAHSPAPAPASAKRARS